MSSDLNGSAGSRPARVVRSATEWAAIMEDFARSGLSRREFCESRGSVGEDLRELAAPSRHHGREGFLHRVGAAGRVRLGRRA